MTRHDTSICICKRDQVALSPCALKRGGEGARWRSVPYLPPLYRTLGTWTVCPRRARSICTWAATRSASTGRRRRPNPNPNPKPKLDPNPNPNPY